MSRGLLIGVIVVTLLSVGVYWSEKAEKSKAGKADPDAAPKLVNVEAGQLQKIIIARKDSEPVVLEKTGKVWSITQPAGFRADQDTIGGVATALADLRWERLLEEKASSLGSFGLESPVVRVTYSSSNGKTGVLLVGDETPTGGNFFAKLDNDPRVFSISSGAKSSMDRTPQDLRDKRLVPYSGEKSLEVTSQYKMLELTKSNAGEWQITKPQPLRADGFQVDELLRRLREAKMDEAKAPFFTLRPIASIKLTDASGVHQLDIRQNPVDKAYYARSSAVEGIHKLAEDFGKSFETGIEPFKNKKLFDFGFNDPTKVEVRGPDKQFSFVKSGEKWWLNGKEMDPAGTQMLIDKLRDLAATQLSTKSFPAVAVTLAVTSEKKTERVSAGTAGPIYLARRENEPATYELPGTSVQEILTAASDVKPAPAPSKK